MPPEKDKIRAAYPFNSEVKKYSDRRLCLQNVGIDMTVPELHRTFIADFPLSEINIYMPKNTRNTKLRTKLVFIDFQRPWLARVALKLIHLINRGKIDANFSVKCENDEEEKPIPKLTQRTFYPESDVPVKGVCSYCENTEAQFVCEFCFTSFNCTFYCNKETCQENHWPEHKYDCRPLPNLVSAEDANQMNFNQKRKLIAPYVDIFKVGESIVISHVANERFLYVRPTSLNEDFQVLLNKINKHSRETSIISKAPEIDDTVLAPLNGGFGRAQVLDVFATDCDGNNLSVFFLENGCTKKLRWNELKSLSYKLRGEKRHVFKSVLKDVQDCKNPEVRSYLNELMKTGEELEVLKLESHGADNYVVLKVKRTSEIVNSKILKFSDVSETQNEKTRILFDESKIFKLPTGSNIKIRIMNATLLEKGFVSCMDAASYNKSFWNLDREINEYGNQTSDEAYDPTLNEICLVKNESRWERGSAVKFEDDIEMILVDTFIYKRIPRKDIRKLPSKLAYKFFTQRCQVMGINDQNFAIATDKIKARSNVFADAISFDENKKCFVLQFKFD